MIFLCCLTFILLLYLNIHWSKKSRLIDKNFPGPRRIPFIGNLSLQLTKPDGIYQYMQNLHKAYNYQPYRFWGFHIPYVVITDSKTAKIILSKLKYEDKAEAYDALEPWLGRNNFLSTGEFRQKYRKFASHIFHHDALRNYLQHFDKNSKILCQKLAMHDGGKAVDVEEYIKLYSIDVLAESFMGVELNSQTKTTNIRYSKAVKNMIRITMRKLMIPILQIKWIFDLTPWSRLEKQSIKTLRDFSKELLERKREERKKKMDRGPNGDKESSADRLLNYLFDNNFTDEEIQIEIEGFFLGGSDNMTSALCFTLYNLAEYQDIQDKVYQEVNSIFGESDECLTDDQLSNMKYTEQVIKETLRLYPSTPAIGRLIKEDVYINENQFIPKNTTVGIVMSAIHRDPKQWINPDVFDPDRFSEENCKKIDYYSFVPFSAGPRQCPGYKYAMLQMKVTIAHIVKQFKLSLSGRVEDKINVSVDYMLTSTNGFQIKFQSRHPIKKCNQAA